MKKQILSVVLLTFAGSLAANAQNVKQMVKSKADSAKKTLLPQASWLVATWKVCTMFPR